MEKRRINAKQKGARRERQVRKILESHGYLVVKAGGSLGMFDLLAVGSQLLYMIQVKSNRMPGKIEMKRIADFPCPSYAVKEIWVLKDRVKDPEIIVVE